VITRRASALALSALLAALAVGGPARAQTEDECIAANDRAVSLRRAGKLIEARKELTTCAAPACPDVIRDSCARRVAETASAIPGLVLEAKDPSGNDVSDVVVRVDGVVVAERLNGVPIELDPGPHDFVLTRAGQPPVTRQFVLREGEPTRREVVVVGAPPSRVEGPLVPPPSGVPVDRTPASAGSALRTWGIVLGAAGVVGMAGGVVGALVGKSTYDSASQPQGSDPECSVGGVCTADGAHRQQTAHAWATASTAVFIGGAVLGAAGITLFAVGTFSSPRREATLTRLVLAPTPTGAVLRGTW
jgi:hypothetical protein